MTNNLINHDFLENNMKDNGLYLNQMLDFLRSFSETLKFDITKLGVSTVPFIDQPDDPTKMTIDKPTLIGYNGDLWLAVPKIGGGTSVYNMTSILKSGVIGNINDVFADPSTGKLEIKVHGDLGISKDTAAHYIEIDSSTIDLKIAANTTLAQKGVDDAKDAYDRAISAQNTANTAIITADNAKAAVAGAVTSANEAKQAAVAADAKAVAADTKAAAADTKAVAAQTSATTNRNEINTLKPTVTKNTADINTNKTGLAATKADVAGNKLDILTNKTGITDLDAVVVKTITSSDSSVTVSKVGNTVDLKTAGGGGAGTVKSVGGKSPKADGSIPIESDPTISTATSTDPNSIRLKVNISKTAGNAISVNADGLFSSGGGTPSPSGISTIDGNQPVSNNYDLVMEDNTLESDSTETGKTKLKVKINPDADNTLRVSPTGLKARANKLTSVDKSITIAVDPSDAREFDIKVALDPTSDNIIKSSGTGLYAAPSGGHSHQEADTVYFDDTYVGGNEDGTFDKPYSTLTHAIDTAMSHSAASKIVNTVKCRDTASYSIGRGETYKLGATDKYIGMSFEFLGKRFEGNIQIDFDGKTSDLLNTIEMRCHDFAGSFDVVNEGIIADIANQEDGINVYLNCNYKSTRTDRMQFGIDATGLTGISKKAYAHYIETVTDAIIEGANVGTTSNINCILPDTFTNFEFRANTSINAVDSDQVSPSSPITKVNYVNVDYTGTTHPTLKTIVAIRCPDKALTFIFDQENADENISLTSGLITATEMKADNIQSKTGEFKGEVVLSKLVNPVTEGGIAYDKTDKAILVKTADGIIKLSQMSSDSRAKILAAAKRVTIEDIIDTNYEKKSIFIPRSYISTFDDNTDIPTNLIEIDTAEIGIRRKDITIGSDPATAITYPKNLLMDVHDFAADPVYHGLAHFKMADISAVTIIADATDPDLNLDTISLTIGGGLDESTIRDLLREGFVYSVQQGTTGRPYVFILQSIVSVNDSTGVVVLHGFSNVIATTNISTTVNKPYVSNAEVQLEQSKFDHLYFGDTVDFVLNKSYWKTKNRESMFPQYYPLFISSDEAPAKQSIALVPFNSRMDIASGKANKTIGNKAIVNNMIPRAMLKFFADKWGTTTDKLSYQVIGLPLMLAIIDDARGADSNDCREFMPVKIYTSDNNFRIKLYSGNGGTELAKFQQTSIFGDAKSKWTGLTQEDELIDSGNLISSYVQDCAYINELGIVFLPEKSLSTGKYAGFTQASATLINGNREVFVEANDLITEHSREGFFGMSEDIGSDPVGSIQYMWTTANENAQVYCRYMSGSFLSPFEVQTVNVIRSVEKPPIDVRTLYAIVTNDQSSGFNAARYNA